MWRWRSCRPINLIGFWNGKEALNERKPIKLIGWLVGQAGNLRRIVNPPAALAPQLPGRRKRSIWPIADWPEGTRQIDNLPQTPCPAGAARRWRYIHPGWSRLVRHETHSLGNPPSGFRGSVEDLYSGAGPLGAVSYGIDCGTGRR